MTDRSSLGERMKRHEAPYRQVLPRRTYTLLRLDGRAFHSYLQTAKRPYDKGFMDDMDRVAEALCKEISGAQFAYTQSDEISVLVTDFETHNTEPWFGGVAAKIVSISAALATAVLNDCRPLSGRPLFDSRAFTVSDPVEVANYFVWRQRDAERNSIMMTAQARFSHKQLHGVKTGQMLEMLADDGIAYAAHPAGFRLGRLTEQEFAPVPGDGAIAVRSFWATAPAPKLTAQPGEDLARRIPALPSYAGCS